MNDKIPPPTHPKIYHILHYDRLPSIVGGGFLLSDARMRQQQGTGTTIGMSDIKARRLTNGLASHSGLHVGECVPFYFCPRSVMLYVIEQRHPNLSYSGGQGSIVHLEADLHRTIQWATTNGKRWAFTLSNAGSNYFKDRSDINDLNQIDWNAVQATKWSGSGIPPSVKEGKQAEFLIEDEFPWDLVDGIGHQSGPVAGHVNAALANAVHKPIVAVQNTWYY